MYIRLCMFLVRKALPFVICSPKWSCRVIFLSSDTSTFDKTIRNRVHVIRPDSLGTRRNNAGWENVTDGHVCRFYYLNPISRERSGICMGIDRARPCAAAGMVEKHRDIAGDALELSNPLKPRRLNPNANAQGSMAVAMTTSQELSLSHTSRTGWIT